MSTQCKCLTCKQEREIERLREALSEIVNPLAKWRLELREDERLNGAMCVALLADPETYKDIARNALRGEEE